MTDGKPKCVETLREIEALVDDELDASVRVRIEAHLVDCPPCMDHAAFRRHLKVMVSTKCSGDAVPPELHDKILQLLREDLPAG
jgi:mycothiol system anti-sigma-R factor